MQGEGKEEGGRVERGGLIQQRLAVACSISPSLSPSSRSSLSTATTSFSHENVRLDNYYGWHSSNNNRERRPISKQWAARQSVFFDKASPHNVFYYLAKSQLQYQTLQKHILRLILLFTLNLDKTVFKTPTDNISNRVGHFHCSLHSVAFSLH